MHYGPILPHDADAKYTEDANKTKGGITTLFKKADVEAYEKSLEKSKRLTKKRDEKTNLKAEVSENGV